MLLEVCFRVEALFSFWAVFLGFYQEKGSITTFAILNEFHRVLTALGGMQISFKECGIIGRYV